MSPWAAAAREWALHLFQMTLQGSLVAVVLLPIVAAARRSSPGFRSALLSIALAKFLLPPMIPLPTGVFSRFDAAPEAFFSLLGVRACAAIALVHVAGFAVSLVRLGVGRRRANDWRRRSLPLTGAEDAAGSGGPEIRVSAEVPVPCAVGGRRPAILLPDRLARALGRAELEAVIAHEREHLARRDPMTTAFESFVSAFWWFHPVVRAVVARRRTIREERCDDAVVRRTPREVYRRALLAAAALAASKGPAGSVAAIGPAAELARRLRRIGASGRPGRRRRLAAAAAIAAAAALFVPGVRPAAGSPFHASRTSR